MKILAFLRLTAALIISTHLDLLEAVMSLQLPGISYGSGDPITVDVDFLDESNNPFYTLKGEVFIQSAPLQSNSFFLPDKLTSQQQFIRKIRIKAGESGMLLKLFESPTSSVPSLMILMKSGFLNNKEPIVIDLMGGDDHQTIKSAEINWYNRDRDELKRMGGFHIGKLEVHVERSESAPLKPSLQFVPQITSPNPQNNMLYPESLKIAANAPSYLQQSPFNLGSTLSAPIVPASNVYLNMSPAPQQQQSRFPNAPIFA